MNEESPELLELVDDFKCNHTLVLFFNYHLLIYFCLFALVQMTELKDYLQPILELISKDLLPPSAGVDYIKTKFNLIMRYSGFSGLIFKHFPGVTLPF